MRIKGSFIDAANTWLPTSWHIKKPVQAPANILVIGATNRASDLDSALLRPGRFDRNIYFGLPGRAGRRDIIDYYLGKKAHDAELDEPARRDTLAALTAGYSCGPCGGGRPACRGTTCSTPR
jgi:cell division protease FtsH